MAGNPTGGPTDPDGLAETAANTGPTPDVREEERFEFLGTLGRGGMGTVFRARDRRSGRMVAIKEMHPIFEDEPGYVARFEREVEVARRIHSPNVVSVLGYGRRNNNPYMVMELVEGQSLRDLLKERGSLSWEEAKPIIVQVADGLRAAHRADVIHRDIKPSNILLAPDGTVKLADFGIARANDLTRLTGGATMLGTPAYMAPENAPSPQSDLYAVGCVLYEMLSGDPPFNGDSQQEILIKHLRDRPDLNRLPVPARRIVGALLQKAPQRRPQSATALLVELEAAPTTPTPNAREMEVTPAPGRGSPRGGAARPTAGAPLAPRTMFIGAAALFAAVILAVIITSQLGGGGTVIPPAGTGGTTQAGETAGVAGENVDQRLAGIWQYRSSIDGTDFSWDNTAAKDGKFSSNVQATETGSYDDSYKGTLILTPAGGSQRGASWNPQGGSSDLAYGIEPNAFVQFALLSFGTKSVAFGQNAYTQNSWTLASRDQNVQKWTRTGRIGALTYDLSIEFGPGKTYTFRATAKDEGTFTAKAQKMRLVSGISGITDRDYEFVDKDTLVVSGEDTQTIWKRAH